MGSVNGCMMYVLSEIQLETKALLFEPFPWYSTRKSPGLILGEEGGGGTTVWPGNAKASPLRDDHPLLQHLLGSHGDVGLCGRLCVLTQKARESDDPQVLFCLTPPVWGCAGFPDVVILLWIFGRRKRAVLVRFLALPRSPPPRRSIGVEHLNIPGPILSAKVSSVLRFS